MSYSRFTQYVHYIYPGVRLTRTAEDLCDCCVRLDIFLQQPDLSEDEIQAILLEKKTHIDEAIAQRRFVSSFIKEYITLHAPNQSIPNEIIPDTIQADDYGGGISMPYYGHSRPSADYFNSNLMIQNFVVADITHGINNVYFYDERGQDKNADVLCSLRLLYHLKTIQRNACNGVTAAEVSFSLLDNCVGQNKSKVVMMFFAMLSIIIPYKKVVLCFLLPGHSHNIADRV
ncbi:cleavage inducible protein [Phytophthora infestans T30-4]|uniref:Cleavage inducible protein n=1 Tax=Phytophthora infestans (strain T30-4) TaxID=403677 RepID=D0NRG6_PHYIT|nr:cleavage inducible protein [Phytophthora infestans T30-4]EEY63316.1 cleavage inducible protein [Phytophthora infestans T30-4]|eukprot:XP_002898201.1 cleavage inducible protein [Phytophthora infestans T30-4]